MTYTYIYIYVYFYFFSNRSHEILYSSSAMAVLIISNYDMHAQHLITSIVYIVHSII